VHDYTSQSFLNALKRMMARRGKVTRVYSDNGTNFVGANRELKEIRDFLRTKDFQNAVVDNLTNDGIEWRFIPPNSPHVGGIWEAGVKSFKNHFKRIAGTSLLTAEEMYTLLTLRGILRCDFEYHKHCSVFFTLCKIGAVYYKKFKKALKIKVHTMFLPCQFFRNVITNLLTQL
jgi:hypothetical protein